MKCQDLFSLKNKKNQCCLLQILLDALRVKGKDYAQVYGGAVFPYKVDSFSEGVQDQSLT